jgi:hypothetical protein
VPLATLTVPGVRSGTRWLGPADGPYAARVPFTTPTVPRVRPSGTCWLGLANGPHAPKVPFATLTIAKVPLATSNRPQNRPERPAQATNRRHAPAPRTATDAVTTNKTFAEILAQNMTNPHPIPGASRLASLPLGGDGTPDVDLDCG